jgi:DNA-binding Xre family transcriptional regulator
MVKLQIRQIAEQRGIKTAYGLQMAMNIPPGTAARLWRGDMSMIGLQTVDALCEALECEPGDLLTRKRGVKAASSTKKQGLRRNR